MAYHSTVKQLMFPILVDLQAATGTFITWIPNFGGIIHDIQFWNSVVQAGSVSTAPIVVVDVILGGTTTADYIKWTGSTSNTGNLAVLGKTYDPDATYLPSGATPKLPFVFNSGDTISIEVDTAQSGGTANTPKGYFVFFYEVAPDGVHA